jgi:hypothetical protein
MNIDEFAKKNLLQVNKHCTECGELIAYTNRILTKDDMVDFKCNMCWLKKHFLIFLFGSVEPSIQFYYIVGKN